MEKYEESKLALFNIGYFLKDLCKIRQLLMRHKKKEAIEYINSACRMYSEEL